MEDFNPLRARLDADLKELAALQASKTQLSARLAWHDNFDHDAAEAELRAVHAGAATRDVRLAEIEGSLNVAKMHIRKALPAAGMGWNPMHWFSDDRAEALAQLRQGRAEIAKLEAKKATLTQEQEASRAGQNGVRSSLNRYAEFDRSGAEIDLASLHAAIEALSAEVESLHPRVQAIDVALEPALKEYKNAQRRIDEMESDRDTADRFQRELDRASDKREKWEIHEKCERRFGTGNPREVANRIRRQLATQKRDATKLERRLHEIARRESLDVHALVIDGSNLVYGTAARIGDRL